ncbi:putative glyoxalase superfamily protein PhnB [Chitinophaga skermanii]|uniref:Putative glyoxalase superfamily protein PhnB n=1 Tax=Chitinophaga skermanii TaxID=331697 RepID=A0A327QSS2_9BACT|nr:VOC family protein [Chitinophaga skermanii]RAJ06684.1 putative glyoxalase superfamily protein PhnB [Chitinophaga skermanii]
MENVKVAPGHQTVMPYLILKHAEKFLDFTITVFGAKVTNKTLREDHKTIMHAEITIGDSTIMFAESTETYAVQNAGLFIYVADTDTTYKLAMQNKCISVFEPTDQPYGRTSGVIDTFGNTWWITSL